MLSQKEKMIFYAKISSILCIVFTLGFIVLNLSKLTNDDSFISQKVQIECQEEEIKGKAYKIQNLNFFIMAFILGAYWNVNDIKKIGVL
ncbi:MAG: hypothetical protein MJ252_31095 [archaeon]|nr:hypothetical protein [archaeon]